MKRTCRFCKQLLHVTFCDLGKTPLANSYLKDAMQVEHEFPLHALVCEHCLLVQLEQFHRPEEIFSDYAYFSSYAQSWLEHAQNYVEMMIDQFCLNSKHFVIEVASNDGYLLQYFKNKSIPILGIEPAKNIALYANQKGIPTLVQFLGLKTAREIVSKYRKADLVIGNNVLAHVPDLNDFISGLSEILAPHGLMTLEFPHLLQLLSQNQFDTIYHEHFSYFSLLCVEKIFTRHGLELFDVEELPTHGGSLRIYVQHSGSRYAKSLRLDLVKSKEKEFGLEQMETYSQFSKKIEGLKENIIDFFQNLKHGNKKIVGYGAPAKGNTLLNYCGITKGHLSYTVDRNLYKQGSFLPGTRIPIYSPTKILEDKPDYIFILPWNLKDEIIQQLTSTREWGAKFVIPIPVLEVL